MANVGDQIILDVTLWDFAINKFVRARVWADGVEESYSPVSIPHLTDGYYFVNNPSVLFPADTDHFSIRYEVYNEAGFTTRSNIHGPATEHYKKADTIPDIDVDLDDKLDLIIDLVSSQNNNSQIIGFVEIDYELVGIVEEEAIFGMVEEDFVLVGIVEEDKIIGIIDNDDDLIGEISE